MEKSTRESGPSPILAGHAKNDGMLLNFGYNYGEPFLIFFPKYVLYVFVCERLECAANGKPVGRESPMHGTRKIEHGNH